MEEAAHRTKRHGALEHTGARGDGLVELFLVLGPPSLGGRVDCLRSSVERVEIRGRRHNE